MLELCQKCTKRDWCSKQFKCRAEMRQEIINEQEMKAIKLHFTSLPFKASI